MELSLLNDLAWVLAVACFASLICFRLKLPAVIGFFVTGILVGPHGLGLVEAVHEVEVLAEVGVVALLFAVGIEFSLDALWRIRKTVLLGGGLQMAGTVAGISVPALLAGIRPGTALFLGCLGAVSSTAIVMRILQETGRVDAPVGRNSLGILVFQDLAVVPVILMMPLFAGEAVSATDLLLLVLKAAGIVVATLAAARKLIPWLLFRIVRTRSRELFLLSIVALCASIAIVTAAAGLSLALGAFLAGLVVSESEYSHEAMGNIQPLRDVFACFFFVFVGMLLDPVVFVSHPFLVTGCTLGLIAVKLIAGAVAVRATGYPLSVAFPVGLFLAQGGEFAFVILGAAAPFSIVSETASSLIVAVAVVSMAAAPFLAGLGARLEEGMARKEGRPAEERFSDDAADHLVIVGFGLCGQHLAEAAKRAGISYGVIEMNPETVRRLRAQGEEVLFGDAGQEAVLHHARITSAAVLVVAVNDPVATRRVTVAARRMNPRLHLIVRTPYVAEVEELFALGADQVIPEEFETSVEIFSRVLNRYRVPRETIGAFVADIRQGGYAMFRGLGLDAVSCSPISCRIPETDIATVRLSLFSGLAGQSLAQSGIREQHHVSVLAIEREGEMRANPEPDMVLAPGDLLYLFGKAQDVAAFSLAVASESEKR